MCRRHEGITAAQLTQADTLLGLGSSFLAYYAAPLQDDLKLIFSALGSVLIWIGVDALSWMPSPLDTINHANADRGIDSFSDEDCYRELRFTSKGNVALTLTYSLHAKC